MSFARDTNLRERDSNSCTREIFLSACPFAGRVKSPIEPTYSSPQETRNWIKGKGGQGNEIGKRTGLGGWGNAECPQCYLRVDATISQ